MRVTANVEAADVASSLAPPTAIAVLLKALALLAPIVAKADRKTAFDLEELPPGCYRPRSTCQNSGTEEGEARLVIHT